MKTALVTGAGGFIGSYLVQELATHNVFVYAIVRKENARSISWKGRPNVQTLCCELEDVGRLAEQINERPVDVFYHLAWEGTAGAARANSALQLANVQYTIDCLELCVLLKCERFVGAGSLMEREVLETTNAQGQKPAGYNIYSAAKQAAHAMSKAYAAEKGIAHIWGIITNAYGAGEWSPRFINSTIRKMQAGEPLSFTSAVQNYDFIYVTDVAKAFYLLGKQGKPFYSYTIGSGAAKPLKEFIATMQQTFCPEEPLLFGTEPFAGIALQPAAFDTTELRADTGFVPRLTFTQGIAATAQWILAQKQS